MPVVPTPPRFVMSVCRVLFQPGVFWAVVVFVFQPVAAVPPAPPADAPGRVRVGGVHRVTATPARSMLARPSTGNLRIGHPFPRELKFHPAPATPARNVPPASAAART